MTQLPKDLYFELENLQGKGIKEAATEGEVMGF